jgi:7-keto-8-aminopelargonate synthetase-like enzyme
MACDGLPRGERLVELTLFSTYVTPFPARAGMSRSQLPAFLTPVLQMALASCRNDYLGLSTHESVKRAVCAAVAEHGMGPRASSLVAGHTQAQRDLELQVCTSVSLRPRV